MLLLPVQLLWAQGVTTSSMQGVVTDENGEGLPGASVVAIHTPSGTQYGTSALSDGRYIIPNMRVGGPYTLRISYLGFQDVVINDLSLALGQTLRRDVALNSNTQQLGEVVISGSGNNLLNAERTGAATNVSTEALQSLPTISRSLQDFTRLSPLANTGGNGTQFAGSNNRYNQFAIDGIINNDVFGLSGSGTNGGQTGIQPISLDAIDEIQINIAPYDVRQGGFTGGGINAVTRSGTNNFEGSAYFFGNNENFVGSRNPTTGEEADYPEYRDYQLGFRLGGPILKDKLFFFVNGEITRNTTPLAFDPTVSGSGSQVTIDEIQRVINTVTRISPNYDLGTYGAINNETNSDKILAKIDWNINQTHKLTLRHSYTYGESINNSRDNNELRFYNNGVFFPSTTNSSALELNSNFGGRLANHLLLGYTAVRDDREPLGSPFPQVTINNLSGGGSITLGGEYSSVANQLDQDIFSITDNFNIFAGKHTFTLGTHNEFYKFYNLFVQNIFGRYAYNSLEAFESVGTANEVAPTYYQIGYSFAEDGPLQTQGASEFKAMQLGFYAQDEVQASPNLNLTLGLRIDLPIFTDDPPYNATFSEALPLLRTLGVATNTIPEERVLWSPRFGFNWDVLGDQSLKVRGGTGIFTGRVPFVWVSNQYTNNGTLNGTYSIGSSSSSADPISNTDPPVRFISDPYNQPTADYFGGTAGLGDINITSSNFQFPQTWRTNLAVDKALPWGLVATIEAVFSKGINNVNFINLNRQIDPEFTFQGPDQRPRYSGGRAYPDFNEIILLNNTDKGYSYNLVAQLQKQFDNGLAGSIAYTYGRSEDVNSGTSSVAYSNWRYVPNIYGLNNLEASYANFDLRHRVSGFVSYRLNYLNNWGTEVSLFYNGQSGQPVSYIYNGDLNNDGTNNDLIYVPRDRSEINLVDITNGLTADQQWENLNAFIENDSYLDDRRGQYAERNGKRLPFQHEFDLRILQDIGAMIGNTSNRLQLTFDIFNVGNLLNKDWGKVYYVSNQTFELIRYTGLADETSQPTFQYTGAGQTNNEIYNVSDPASRWRGQVGIRYIFN
ncbi:carboxypeptidase regulatory-like domain-containing protein [Pontibacter silvestris]|uniref:Carboxypeptidase regulatory-like domain-containing protein n=2 Tax=Pontibacter silvestris TaxID=2305183 RepID=A0ABW4WU43_9BACT|nr:carboxypeptidase regulatory-like domain-containing protein [Pontibacter silvestris]MCC9138109.1 carboxypeptidase regulatory-like domain-containing protein [Pontibacter silvestris]